MNIFRVSGKLLTKYLCLLMAWAILSTIVPYWVASPNAGKSPYDSLYELNQATVTEHSLSDADVIFVTAHPDDESMFFSPVIVELSKAKYNNALHLICFSDGNFDGLGETRQQELIRAASILGFQTHKTLDYVDNIHEEWDTSAIAATLAKELKELPLHKSKQILVSFDEEGVSGHPNHKSLYYGVQNYSKKHKLRFFKLKSWPVAAKYSAFVITNVELIARLFKNCSAIHKYLPSLVNYIPDQGQAIKIYANFNSWFLNLATMTYAHYSQIVWYRWLWIFLSRYMNCNELELVI
ncbi:hypothetical protein KL938_001643 [Ogataea parapolymorpha]|nr:hypothetical protein KL938_001643 [Ogataea parapolymorpha]